MDAYTDIELRTRVERLEQSRGPMLLYSIAIGAIGMGIIFLLLIGLAILYGGFR